MYKTGECYVRADKQGTEGHMTSVGASKSRKHRSVTSNSGY